MAGVMDRRSWDDNSGEQAVDNFNRVAAQLEALMTQRDQDVRAAMGDYQADGVSGEYQAKEARWHQVAGQVRSIITALRGSLEQSREIAQTTTANAARSVAQIG